MHSSASKPDAWGIITGDYDLQVTFPTYDEALTAMRDHERRFPHLRFRVAPVEWAGDELLIEPRVPSAPRAQTATRRVSPRGYAGQH